MHEIYGLRLPVELVVLSACQTALGREIHGEGLVGLVRGFMYAGAPRVVASLWKVDDQATSELMKHFYKGMLVDGLRPDSINPQDTPTLDRLKREGVFYLNSHCVFPTVTRVNAASISTGSYPSRHGLVSNSMFYAGVYPNRAFNTGDWRELLKLAESSGGRLIFGLHNYPDVTRMVGKRTRNFLRRVRNAEIWITETGGIVRHRHFKYDESRADKVVRHVFKLVRDMRGGKDYDSKWGERQTGSGPIAWMIGRRFEAACEKLNLNTTRSNLTTEHFSPPKREAAQLTLF
jgi:hypothetical protein